MCYYSVQLRSDQFRNARTGEDLKIVADSPSHGHHYAAAESDGKIVCILDRDTVHIEALTLEPVHRAGILRQFPSLAQLEGKPVTAQFVEGRHCGYSYDRIVINGGIEVHFIYLGTGMKFYLGAKRPDVATKLGVDDPSIALDHRTDVAPTQDRVLRVREYASINR